MEAGMELNELVDKSHELHEQLKNLQIQKQNVKQEINAIENEIKVILDESGEDYDNLSEEQFQLLMADLGDPSKLTVEVVYVTDEQQQINEVQLSRGATIEDSIIYSGILDKCADIDLEQNKIGIYGVIKPLSELVKDGDRIEIYRPIKAKV